MNTVHEDIILCTARVMLFIAILYSLFVPQNTYAQDAAAQLCLKLDERYSSYFGKLFDMGFRLKSDEDKAWDLCHFMATDNTDDSPGNIAACFFIGCSASSTGANCARKADQIQNIEEVWRKKKYWRCP